MIVKFQFMYNSQEIFNKKNINFGSLKVKCRTQLGPPLLSAASSGEVFMNILTFAGCALKVANLSRCGRKCHFKLLIGACA